MKKIFNTIVIALLATILFSCKKDEMPDVEVSTTGEVDFATLNVTYDPTPNVLYTSTGRSSKVIDTGEFIISVYSTSNNEKKGEWKYKDLPEVFTLQAGSYRLEVASHIPQDAAWDAPYYFAQENFEIKVDKVTPIGDVECVLSNVKVTVEYSDELLSMMGDDCKVNISVGKGTLDFTKNETRAGYFTVTSTSNRLYAYFIGSVDGYVDTTYREIENVKAGEWRILRYSLKQNTDENVESGTFSASVKVDVSCQLVEQNVQVSVDEDVIEDPEGNKTGDDDNPSEPPVTTQGPVISASAFDITQPQTITSDLIIQVDVTSEIPLAGLTVDIESTTLTASELEAVGLQTHLDLGNPGDLRDKLEGLGFPVAENIIGKNAISFDITPFGGLLSALGAGTHKFIMTATDQNDNKTEQTLTLITK